MFAIVPFLTFHDVCKFQMIQFLFTSSPFTPSKMVFLAAASTHSDHDPWEGGKEGGKEGRREGRRE